MANLTDAVPHAELISAQLPLWARHITPQHWQAISRSQRFEAFDQDWYNNAAPDLREAVTASHARLLRAQAALARSLKGLKQISEFAEPLLQARLTEAGFTARCTAANCCASNVPGPGACGAICTVIVVTLYCRLPCRTSPMTKRSPAKAPLP